MTPNSSLTFIPNRLVQDKDQSRKLIELRLFTRIDGKDGLAKSKGISNVNDQVKPVSYTHLTLPTILLV